MEGKTQDEVRLTQFLLGELSESEREQIEEIYFGDDALFEQILVAEDELIDAYVGGELSELERERFERLFLASPRGRERVNFARALVGAVSSTQPLPNIPEPSRSSGFSLLTALRSRSPALRFAFTAAMLLMAVGLTWLLIERARMRDQLRQLREEQAVLRESKQELEQKIATEQTRSKDLLARLEEAKQGKTQPQGEIDRKATPVEPSSQDVKLPGGQSEKNDPVIAQRTPSRSGVPTAASNTANNSSRLPDRGRPRVETPGTASFELTSSLVRGGGENTLTLSDKARFILLQLNLETNASHKNYHAVIETAEGREVWRAQSVKPRRSTGARRTIKLPALPATALAPGNYVLLLSGRQPDGSFEDVADYSFRIVRR